MPKLSSGSFRLSKVHSNLESGIQHGKKEMLPRSPDFLDLEMPLNELTKWITPVNSFFVRNHMNEPAESDLNHWRLSVNGEVKHPLELSLSDLKKFADATVTNTLECAGNGRQFYDPPVPGTQWEKGAVGTAIFSGPRLKDVLERAGVSASAKHVMFKGSDHAPDGKPPFIRSIPIDKAMHSDTLLATIMNGKPLLKHHGYPLRSLVPGWIGAASVKWITEIRVLDNEYDGYFMKSAYRLRNESTIPGKENNETHAITELPVKSIIAAPENGAHVPYRAVRISGAAWAGEADIERVEISIDGGSQWQLAELGHERAKYAWRLWEYEWRPSQPGSYILMSRATDSRGRAQTDSQRWNPGGYLWNQIDRVQIVVIA